MHNSEIEHRQGSPWSSPQARRVAANALAGATTDATPGGAIRAGSLHVKPDGAPEARDVPS